MSRSRRRSRRRSRKSSGRARTKICSRNKSYLLAKYEVNKKWDDYYTTGTKSSLGR